MLQVYRIQKSQRLAGQKTVQTLISVEVGEKAKMRIHHIESNLRKTPWRQMESRGMLAHQMVYCRRRTLSLIELFEGRKRGGSECLENVGNRR